MKAFKWILGIMVIMLLVYAGCRKTNDKFKYYLQVNLTDTDSPNPNPDPVINYRGINIDLQKVLVHYSGVRGHKKWVEINTRSGIYNLVDLKNNLQTVIAKDGSIPLGKIDQIRLILGTNNTIAAFDGRRYELQIPPSAQDKLTVSVNADLEIGRRIMVMLDFDALSSVTHEGDGTFVLNPVLTVKSVENS